jgi:hypothetical protein
MTAMSLWTVPRSRAEEKIHHAGFPGGLLEGIDHLQILAKGPHTPEVEKRGAYRPICFGSITTGNL